MTDLRGTTPIIYKYKQDRLDGTNGGGEGSGQLVPIQTTSVKEVGSEVTPIVVDVMLGTPVQPM